MFLRTLPLIAPLVAVCCALVAPVPAWSQKPAPAPAPATPSGPKSIGKFDDWTAATHQEAGQKVCYAFTRAQTAGGKSNAIMTVTQRAAGRDAVAIDAGYLFPPNAAVSVQVDAVALEFYTAQRNAFARDGKAAVAAFQKGSRAVTKGPGAKDGQVSDTFSMKGFSAAYAAIVKECPPK